MTKKTTEKHRYTTIDGKLCIQHYLLLQQLKYRKKLKSDEYKKYTSYHIKFPRAVHDLLDPIDETIYLEIKDEKIILHKNSSETYKKVRFQKNNKTNADNVSYQLTIPKKMLKIEDYQRGEYYILCQIKAANTSEGYSVSLELIIQ